MLPGIVQQICDWKARDWDLRFVHICREANQVVDELASLAHDLELGTLVLDRPPPRCSNLLLFDVSGVSFPRSTRL